MSHFDRDAQDLDVTQDAHGASAADDPRLLAAVQEYMAAMDAGRRPNRQEFIARHPEIAADLSACLQGLNFINSAAAQINANDDGGATADLTSGRPLGDFRLIREIGRGGMGVVYEATQLSLDRRVAVKVLTMAAAFDPRHLQRFRNEAQAAAQLHHTNIVPVYAVGCERSVHYYAMQLIDGQSLAEVIEELRGISGRARAAAGDSFEPSSGAAPTPRKIFPPSSVNRSIPQSRFSKGDGTHATFDGRAIAPLKSAANLSSLHSLHGAKPAAYFQAVARLGLQAAEALFYAHQQGVVHRDIKPANLLLDGQGTLWVTDFGLALMYADNGLTQTGDVLGTFRYMSPEQASGRAVVLDQRTDIYSLGITLYELLTLERALPGQTREELMHQISSVDPRAPRSIDRKIPVELENIVTKAMAKDPAERYATARALADDLQRFLSDEPVLARPPSLWNKTVKWTRRHRTVAASAFVILLIVAVSSTIGSVLIAREQSKTKLAYVKEQRKTAEATEQRKLAEKSFEQAREAVDFFTNTALKDFPTDPKFFQIRWRMLENSMAYYQSFLDQRKDDPSIAAQLNAAEAQVSTVLAELAAVDELLRTNFEIRLLSRSAIQKDLQLTPAQILQANALAADVGSRPPEVKPDATALTSQQVRQAVSQDSSQRTAAIAQVLSPVQQKRLHEISRQIRGVFAFSDRDVAAALALTPSQKNAVRSACAEFHNRNHHGPRSGGRESEHADMQMFVDRIVAQLTAHQIEQWTLLTGEPYTGPAPHFEFWFMPQRDGRDGHDTHDGFDGGPKNHGAPDGPPPDDGGPDGPGGPNDHGPDGRNGHGPGGPGGSGINGPKGPGHHGPGGPPPPGEPDGNPPAKPDRRDPDGLSAADAEGSATNSQPPETR